MAFTLLELMIVVAIVAVLATIAIVSYARHIKSARIVDAQAFIATIQAREETYFQQFGTYCNASGDSYHPALLPSGEPVAKPWNPAGASPAQLTWVELGARPESGYAYFEFRAKAGLGTTTDTLADTLGVSSSGGNPWYFVIARGNLDGQGTCADPPAGGACTLLWATSVRSSIVTANELR
jgi:type IV pilus assembly protein PilE